MNISIPDSTYQIILEEAKRLGVSSKTLITSILVGEAQILEAKHRYINTINRGLQKEDVRAKE